MRILVKAILCAGLLLAQARPAAVPRPSGEFHIKGTSGSLLLSQFRGKVVLLFFLFTT